MSAYQFRPAASYDLVALVEMLADDHLGQTRESPGEPVHAGYAAAFAAIQEDPNNELIVCESDGNLLGMLQITFIPGLSYVGAWRAQIEGVRVSSSARNAGIGQRLVERAIERARDNACVVVQLTSDKRRLDALRFYERLGFTASHEGMKLWLD